MKITNLQNLPQPLVDAIRNDDYNPGEAHISVTGLLKPPRIAHLSYKHRDELTEDAAGMIYALMGKAVHHILERANSAGIAEKRLFITVPDVTEDGEEWIVSGQFDRVAKVGNILQDWKIGSIWEGIFGIKWDKEAQVNIYVEMARVNGYQIDSAQIVMIFRDWSKTDSRRKSNYPQSQVQVFDVPIWPREQTQAYIRERVAIHKAAREGAVADCTPEERWQKKASFAVKKGSIKKAVRVMDTREQAQAFIDSETLNGSTIKAALYSIEERPGEAVRCADYCPVAKFCPQYKADIKHDDPPKNFAGKERPAWLPDKVMA